MKYINKTWGLLFLLTTLLFTACSTDQEGPFYTETGVAFSSGTLTGVLVLPDDPTFTVDVFRSGTSGTLSGKVSITTNPTLDGCTVTDYSFAEGEAKSAVTVNVSPLKIGGTLKITLTIDGTDVAVGGTNQTTLTVSKDYTWLPAGKALFSCGWSGEEVETEVAIQKAKESNGLFRLVSPYYYSEKAAEAEGVTLEEGHHIQFQLDEDNGAPIGFPSHPQSIGEADGDYGNLYFAYTPGYNNCSFTNNGNVYSINGLIAYDGEGEIQLGWYETIIFVWKEGYPWQ